MVIYHLVMTNSSPWSRWPTEIDGLPSNSMVIFHGELLNNQMVDFHVFDAIVVRCSVQMFRALF